MNFVLEEEEEEEDGGSGGGGGGGKKSSSGSSSAASTVNMKGITQKISGFANMSAKQIKFIKKFPKYNKGDTTNVARAAVIAVKSNGEDVLKASSCIYLSKWDRLTNKYDEKIPQKKDEDNGGSSSSSGSSSSTSSTSTAQKYNFCSTGDYYPGMQRSRLNAVYPKPQGKLQKSTQKFNKDFLTIRGKSLDEDVEYAAQSYSHSEQAYFSNILNLKTPIFPYKWGVPKMVILVFVSYHPPCDSCYNFLSRLFENTSLKKAFLRKYFGVFNQGPNEKRKTAMDIDVYLDNIPVHVVYVSVDYIVKDSISLGDNPYFIFSRR